MEEHLPSWAIVTAIMTVGAALLFGLGLWIRYGPSIVLSGFSPFCA